MSLAMSGHIGGLNPNVSLQKSRSAQVVIGNARLKRNECNPKYQGDIVHAS